MNETFNKPLKAGQTRILIADDHTLFREGLKRILETVPSIQIIAEAEDGYTALQQIAELRPDVAILDLSMPGLSGMNLLKRVKQDVPTTSVLVLTMHAEEQYALRAFRSGASGYLTKDSAAEQLVGAVQRIADGKAYLSTGMAERVAMSLSPASEMPRHTALSDREYEVLRLLVRGLRLTQIGEHLHLSVKTVSTHKGRILEKMGIDTTAALIRYSMHHGLFSDDEASI